MTPTFWTDLGGLFALTALLFVVLLLSPSADEMDE